jgi:urate oxidase
MAYLSSNSYGKRRVRLTKVVRGSSPTGGDPIDPERHEVHEYAVDIMLYGGFDEVYTDSDNASCVPTDTMKNTVYAIAQQTEFTSPEQFGLALTARFISRFDHIDSVEVDIAAEIWKRIHVAGAPHNHSFVKGRDTRTVSIARDRIEDAATDVTIRSGISDLEILKSTGSGFTGFYRDEYTTLPPTTDRILATTVEAEWTYSLSEEEAAGYDFNGAWIAIEQSILEVFATHESPSLQATLYVMGETVLERVAEVASIEFVMPNQHHIRFDLSAFGLENENFIFYGTDSPSGVITGSVSRHPDGS